MGPVTSNPAIIDNRRNFLCRIVFSCVFATLCYEIFSHGLLSQLSSPALIYSYVDITYLLFNLSGIQAVIGELPAVSFLFSLSLFALCTAVIIWPFNRPVIMLFILFYFFYFLSYSNYGAHHVHSKIGILFICVPFAFSGTNYLLLWQGLRYFTLFIYFDAFLWKLFRGTWLFDKQGILILKSNITPLLVSHPDHRLRSFYEYLFLHPGWADVLFKTGVVMEGLFIVGFFTRKYDLYLVINSILLMIGFYIMADAFAFELLILNFTLIYHFDSTKIKNPFQLAV